MDVLNMLYETLAGFGYPVYLQGSMTAETDYPRAFYTYFNNDSNGSMYYDDLENVVIYDFDVNAYCDDPDEAQEMLLAARDALRAEGFIVAGAGYDILSDEPTHTGRGINASYIERTANNG